MQRSSFILNWFVGLKKAGIVLVTLGLFYPLDIVAQDGTELEFQINRVHKPLSISKKTFLKAQSLSDLNKHFESSWIREYIAVEIRTSHQGITRKSVGQNEILTREQKANLLDADVGEDVSVVVRYIPENSLKRNDPKVMDFRFGVDPENEASYSGGYSELELYLQGAVDKIPDGSFINYDMAVVKFTVGTEGEIFNVHLFESSNDEKIDDMLVETIRAMPRWKPAHYDDGTRVSQEFVWIIGSMENCMVNLLNIN